ncbi:MAG TPA: archease [Candidatus Binatia bacterium]|nr:archease [Candidatus Binatia bacterium]
MPTRAGDPGLVVREIEHTADVGFEVEAPTIAALFERAGLATLAIAIGLETVERQERIALEVRADDLTSLLHDWLQQLVVVLQARGIALSELGVDDVSEVAVRGWGAGERVDRGRHRLYTEVKGVTYHELAVQQTAAGWSARVILDV